MKPFWKTFCVFWIMFVGLSAIVGLFIVYVQFWYWFSDGEFWGMYCAIFGILFILSILFSFIFGKIFAEERRGKNETL